MGKLLVAAAVGLLVFTVGLVSASWPWAAPADRPDPAPAGPEHDGRERCREPAAVPAAWLALYEKAAATCPGMPWTVLAAIGTVETGSGQSTAPGVRSGANSAGAEGPMQFEPPTFAAYATVGPGGARPASPYDPIDAVYTAAALLCANGGRLRLEPPLGHRRLQPLRVLRGHRADPVALVPDRTRPPRGTVVAALSFAAQQLERPTCGAVPVSAASTARDWSRLPSPTPGSSSPGWPRTSSTPVPRCPPDRRSNPGTWSSSATAPRPSTTSASTSGRAR